MRLVSLISTSDLTEINNLKNEETANSGYETDIAKNETTYGLGSKSITGGIDLDEVRLDLQIAGPIQAPPLFSLGREYGSR